MPRRMEQRRVVDSLVGKQRAEEHAIAGNGNETVEVAGRDRGEQASVRDHATNEQLHEEEHGDETNGFQAVRIGFVLLCHPNPVARRSSAGRCKVKWETREADAFELSHPVWRFTKQPGGFETQLPGVAPRRAQSTSRIGIRQKLRGRQRTYDVRVPELARCWA